MHPDDWIRIEPHLDALLDLDETSEPGARAAYLDRLFPAEEHALRVRLEALVAECEGADGFLTGGVGAEMVDRARRADLAALTLVGRRLGPFRLTEVLGSGGMGTVFRGERVDGQFEQRVAVKVANRTQLDKAGRARFDFERRILAGLEHPGIARLLDGGVTDDDLPYLVMEEVEGVPIDRAAAELPRADRLRMLARAAVAVDHAHQRRVVHRDLKPSNLLVTPEGETKLLDFGVAEWSDGPVDTDTSSALTVLFAAPEQLDGQTATGAADLWSLGVLLFVLLTGTLPYPSRDDESLTERAERLRRAVPPPSGAGPETDAVVRRALAGSPEARYGSAREFADDLERLADRRAVGALPATPLYLMRAHARRHPTPWVLGLLAIAAVIALFVISAQSNRRAEERAAIARELARDAERIEGFLRHAYALPLHDVRPEVAATRQRMESIRERAVGAARASALLALGRGHAQLREPRLAIEALREAEAAGEQAATRPLGRALAEVWLNERATAAQIRDPLLRRSRLEQLDREFREPALELFARSTADIETTLADPWSPPALGAGYSALLAGDLDAANDAAVALRETTPWLAEGPRLDAEARWARGVAAASASELDAALEQFFAADRALVEATALAPSDPSLRQARCDLSLQQVGLAVQRRTDQTTVFAGGAAACDDARRADPSRAAPYAGIAQLHLARIQDPTVDPAGRTRHLESAREALDQALERDPLDPKSLELAGTLHLTEALRFEAPAGRDPRPYLDRAADFYERAVAEEPGLLGAQVNLGTARAVAAEQTLARGGDAEPLFAQAVDAYRSTLRANPEHPLLLANLATLEFRRSVRARASAAERIERIDAALDTASRALDADRDLVWGWNLTAAARYNRGLVRFARGEDGEDDWRLAEEAAGEALRIDPQYVHALVNRASLVIDRMRRRGAARLSSADRAALDAAEADSVRAHAAAPSISTRQTLHDLHRQRALRAVAARATGATGTESDPRPHLAAARTALELLEGEGSSGNSGAATLQLAAVRLAWIDAEPARLCAWIPGGETDARDPLTPRLEDPQVADAAHRALAERAILCAARSGIDGRAAGDAATARRVAREALETPGVQSDLRGEGEALAALLAQLDQLAGGDTSLHPRLREALERDPFLALEPAGRAVLDRVQSEASPSEAGAAETSLARPEPPTPDRGAAVPAP